MKRSSWIALTMLLFLPLGASAQSVDEVIAKYVQARGGLEKLRAIKSVRMTAKLSEGSFRAGFVQENKRDDKIRQELIIQGMARVQAYDGHTAWQINPFGGRKDPALMSQDDARPLVISADFDGPLVDAGQKGNKTELVGHDSVEGTDCYKLKVTLKNGDLQYYFLDADSFLPIKLESQSNVRGAVRYHETLLGDYEQVDGIYYPFSYESGEPGSDERLQLTVEKVEPNVPLDDTRFSLPATKTEAKPAAAK
jgi:hypothetical protein